MGVLEPASKSWTRSGLARVMRASEMGADWVDSDEVGVSTASWLGGGVMSARQGRGSSVSALAVHFFNLTRKPSARAACTRWSGVRGSTHGASCCAAQSWFREWSFRDLLVCAACPPPGLALVRHRQSYRAARVRNFVAYCRAIHGTSLTAPPPWRAHDWTRFRPVTFRTPLSRGLLFAVFREFKKVNKG